MSEAKILRRLRSTMIEPIGLANVLEARQQCSALLVHVVHAAQVGGNPGRAVIAPVPANEVLAIGLAHHFPVMAHETRNAVVAFRA